MWRSRGNCAIISGPSGCGKTTLAEIIGLAAPSSGRVSLHFDGSLAEGLASENRIKVGYVSQSASVIDGSVLENITLDGNLCDVKKYDDQLWLQSAFPYLATFWKIYLTDSQPISGMGTINFRVVSSNASQFAGPFTIVTVL